MSLRVLPSYNKHTNHKPSRRYWFLPRESHKKFFIWETPVFSTDIGSCSHNGKKYVFSQFQGKNSQIKEWKKIVILWKTSSHNTCMELRLRILLNFNAKKIKSKQLAPNCLSLKKIQQQHYIELEHSVLLISTVLCQGLISAVVCSLLIASNCFLALMKKLTLSSPGINGKINSLHTEHRYILFRKQCRSRSPINPI